MKNSSLFRKFCIYFVVFWTAIMVIIPTLIIIVTSFLTTDAETLIAPPITIASYKNLFNSTTLGLLIKSFKIAILSTLLCLIIGYPFAYILSKAKKKWQPLLLILVIIPFWTNSLIRNYALIGILSTKGFLNTVLLAIGIIDTPLQIMYTDVAVFIGMVYTLLPFMILPIYTSVEKLDLRLLEAAQDLGASSYRTFKDIIIPLTTPGIIAGTIMVFLPSLSMFYIADILGGADSMVLGSLVKLKFLTAKDLPAGSAIGVFFMVIMFVLIWLYQKSNKKFSQYKQEGVLND